MTAYEQRSYPGAAADTVLAADITLGATAFSVTAGTGTGYPDGSQGPFFVIIDYDNSKAEKVRCSGRVNDTFTVAGTGGGRGQDGTTAQAHTAPAKVRACITATDVQEANRAAVNTIGRVTSKGDLTPGSGANTTVRLAVGADGTLLIADSTQSGGVRWTSTGIVLDVTSTIGGVSGTTLAAERAAWTAGSAALGAYGGGASIGAGATQVHRYVQVGKLVTVEFYVIFGTGASFGAGGAYFDLLFPVTPKTTTERHILGAYGSPPSPITVLGRRLGAGTKVELYTPGNSTGLTGAISAGAIFNFSFDYEAA